MVEARLHSWWIEKDNFLVVSGAFSLTGWLMLAGLANRVSAQIAPDNSLGAESSVVNSNTDVRGLPAELIEGGAIRDANLFHSFSEFNVNEGQRVYFANPTGIENILSRVTGANPSNILGTLGVDGAANLYFLNPNGILFGANAQLDIAGSLVASTGDSLVFGDGVEFSARNPDNSPLLTVSVPLGVQYGSEKAGAITNRGFLAVNPGKDIALLGGDLIIDGGGLIVPGGRVDLGGLTEAGTVEFSNDGSFSFPDGVTRGDIFFTNAAFIDVSSVEGGYIKINARNLELRDGSNLFARINEGVEIPGILKGDIIINVTKRFSLLGTSSEGFGSAIFSQVLPGGKGNSGKIKIDTGSLILSDGAIIVSATIGIGDAGIISITANDAISLSGEDSQRSPSAIVNQVFPIAEGNSEGIDIKTGSLSLSDGAAISASTFGKGDAGAIMIATTESISLSGKSSRGRASNISSQVNSEALGNSGGIQIKTSLLSLSDGSVLNSSTFGKGNAENIKINTDSVLLSDGAAINASTFGEGNAGTIIINAANTISLSGQSNTGLGSNIASQVNREAKGNSGGIVLETESLLLSDGSALSASTFGEGNSVEIIINATDTIHLSGESNQGSESNISSQVNPGAKGNSGGIQIETNSLSISDGARLSAETLGEGDAGNITINVIDRMSLLGNDSQGSPSIIVSQVNPGALGKAGKIEIETGSLFLSDGGLIIANTRGIGNAGEIKITALDSISLLGESGNQVPSVIASQVNTGGVGDSGGITINTASLSLLDGARVTANTIGTGNAGAITIVATDIISLSGESSQRLPSAINSQVTEGAEGNSGGIRLTTGSLSILDGTAVSANTLGLGNAGKITINASDSIVLSGKSSQSSFSAIASQVFPEASGNSEGIIVNTGSLSISDGARISASTRGKGNAGAININADSAISLSGEFDGGIFSQVNPEATGNAGNITINSGSLFLLEGARLNASTQGEGDTGAITIDVKDVISLSGETSEGFSSGIFSAASAQSKGKSQGINIIANSLFLSDEARVSARTEGQGEAGDIFIKANILEANNGSQIQATTTTNFDAGDITLEISENLLLSGAETGFFTQTEGAGIAGDITIDTPQLTIDQSASISAFTEASGNSGTITINAPQEITVNNGSELTVETSGAGKPGNIFITTPSLTIGKDAQLSATATENSINTKGGGSITINTSNLDLIGELGIFAETQGVSPAGTLDIQPYEDQTDLNIKFTDTAILSTETSASGAGGDINLTAPETINIRGEGEITAKTSGSGDAGNINFSSQNLNLADGLEVSASTTGEGSAGSIKLDANRINISQAEINAFTNGKGDAGSIFINYQEKAADRVTLRNNAKISTEIQANGQSTTPSNIEIKARNLSLNNNSEITASTSGEGDAGNISVQDAENIVLNQSSISTSVNEGAKGQGGNINFNTRTLSLKGRSQISASSEEEGKAGNITIEASKDVTANDSDITTAAKKSSGGAINISARDMRLRGDSDITTNVNSGAGGGGNINLTADSIIAFDDSDIFAFARDGRGGNITLNSLAFFGESFRPAPENTDPETLEGNDRVDVNASGVVDGVITIPDVSFIQNSLIELPENLLDTDNLLANSCIVRSQEQRGNFTIPGAGGLPTRPGDAAVSPLPTGNVRTLPEKETSTNFNLPKLSSRNYRPWKSGDPIVEPTGVYRLPNGKLIISRDCP